MKRNSVVRHARHVCVGFAQFGVRYCMRMKHLLLMVIPRLLVHSYTVNALEEEQIQHTLHTMNLTTNVQTFEKWRQINDVHEVYSLFRTEFFLLAEGFFMAKLRQ